MSIINYIKPLQADTQHCDYLLYPDQNLHSQDQQTPSSKEINRSIEAIAKKFPNLSVFKIVSILYQKLIVNKFQDNKPVAASFIDKEYKFHNDDDLISTLKETGDDDQPPKIKFNLIVKEPSFHPKQRTRQIIPAEDPPVIETKKISQEVYSRFRPNKKKESTASQLDLNSENEQNLKRIMEWKVQVNKVHHIIVNKIAPKFHNREEEIRYHEKRLTAKAFCERTFRDQGETQDPPQDLKLIRQRRRYNTWRRQLRQFYNQQPLSVARSEKAPPLIYDENSQRMDEIFLAQITRHLQSSGMSEFRDKRRYKTVACAFVNESYLRLQLFLTDSCGMKLRRVTAMQMRALHSILLNCQQFFDEDEYMTFRRIIKLTFDLGSVSIYEESARKLYIRVHSCLRDRIDIINRQNQISEEFKAKREEIKAQQRIMDYLSVRGDDNQSQEMDIEQARSEPPRKHQM